MRYITFLICFLCWFGVKAQTYNITRTDCTVEVKRPSGQVYSSHNLADLTWNEPVNGLYIQIMDGITSFSARINQINTFATTDLMITQLQVWKDSCIADGGGGTVVTENAISGNGSATTPVKLGGTLSENTTIDYSTFKLTEDVDYVQKIGSATDVGIFQPAFASPGLVHNYQNISKLSNLYYGHAVLGADTLISIYYSSFGNLQHGMIVTPLGVSINATNAATPTEISSFSVFKGVTRIVSDKPNTETDESQATALNVLSGVNGVGDHYIAKFLASGRTVFGGDTSTIDLNGGGGEYYVGKDKSWIDRDKGFRPLILKSADRVTTGPNTTNEPYIIYCLDCVTEKGDSGVLQIFSPYLNEWEDITGRGDRVQQVTISGTSVNVDLSLGNVLRVGTATLNDTLYLPTGLFDAQEVVISNRSGFAVQYSSSANINGSSQVIQVNNNGLTYLRWSATEPEWLVGQ